MTSEIPPIEKVAETRKSSEIEHQEHVDPEKFRRILKVEESDESQKRKQRQRSSQEEEVEEESGTKSTSSSSTPPPGFSSLMPPPTDGASIFDLEQGATQTYETSSEAPAGEATPTPINVYSPAKTSTASKTPTPPPEITVTTSEAEKISIKESASARSDTKAKQEPPAVPETKKATPALKKTAPAPPLSVEITKQSPPPAQVEKAEPPPSVHIAKETPPPAHVEKAAPPPSVHIAKETSSLDLTKPAEKTTRVEQEEAAQTAQKKDAAKKGEQEVQEGGPPILVEGVKELQGSKKSETPTSVTEVNKQQETPEQLVLAPEEGEQPNQSQDQKSKPGESKKEFAAIEGLSSTLFPSTSLGVSAAQSTAYARLSSETFELFQKMVGIMTIEKLKGVSTTTVTLNMPGSVFDKCQVRLDHYDTAPHSFNVQLLGNPDAVRHFSANLTDLTAAFQASKLSFEINIQRPVLLHDQKPDQRQKKQKKQREDETFPE